MANWSNPLLTSLYTDVLTDLKNRDIDAITLQYSAPSNLPTGAIKWNRTDNKFQEWNGSAFVDKVISIAGGGTGATSAADARTALSLGTIATQNSNAVTITGGSITGLSTLGVSGNISSTGNGTFSGTLSAVAGGTVPVKSENATITGQWSFSNFLISSVSPYFRISETDQAVGSKNWDFIADGAILYLRILDDAYSVTKWAVTISREGMLTAYNGLRVTGSPTLGAIAGSGLINYESTATRIFTGDGSGYTIRFSKRSASVTTDLITIAESGTIFTVNGTASIQQYLAITGDTANLDFYDTGAAADQKNWRWHAEDQNLILYTLTDAWAATERFRFTRSGAFTLTGQLTTPAGAGGSSNNRAIQIGSDAGVGIYGGTELLVLGVRLDDGASSIASYLQLHSTGFDYDHAGTTRLQFYAHSPSFSPTFEMKGSVYSYGLFPLLDNTYQCGDTSYRWTAVYAVNGTIQTSDENAKTILGPSRGLDFIRCLNPFEYDWKASPTGKRKMGLGARNINSQFPELDLVHRGLVGSDEENDYYGMNYSELIAPIIKAIQELDGRLNSLQAGN